MAVDEAPVFSLIRNKKRLTVDAPQVLSLTRLVCPDPALIESLPPEPLLRQSITNSVAEDVTVKAGAAEPSLLDEVEVLPVEA
jgi:hypothetical protein